MTSVVNFFRSIRTNRRMHSQHRSNYAIYLNSRSLPFCIMDEDGDVENRREFRVASGCVL